METIIDAILEKSKYQYFPELGHNVKISKSKTHSNSPEKLKCLHLPNLTGKKVLDVGCSFGFFSFEAYKLGASEVIGIDIEQNNIDGANALKELGFKFEQHLIDFQCCDFETYAKNNYKLSLNVIMALSVLHYFKNKTDFFRKAYELLKPSGLLIIELPMANINNDRFYIHKIEQPNFPVQFIPNWIALETMYRTWFNCTAQYESNIPQRIVYYLQRKI